jgi:hypothetical protein
LIKLIIKLLQSILGIGDWGLGIGDGDWGLGMNKIRKKITAEMEKYIERVDHLP